MEVCLLGTGGMLPLPGRHLTSLMIRHGGRSLLIDCGEGTQVAMRRRKWSPARIDAILLTHCHADHVAGLPGLLLSMGNAGHTEPLTIAGPKGIAGVVAAVRVLAPDIPFELRCEEFEQDECALELAGLHIEAFHVRHRVPCYGYSVVLPRAGRFLPEKARVLGIPQALWGQLQRGEPVEHDGATVTPDRVLGAPRKGIRVTYCTDTRPVPAIEKHAANSDLLILEGIYGDPAKVEKAREKLHMTMQEAASIAARADVPELWLTHYSPAMTDPQEYIEDVRAIFPGAVVAQDGQTKELRFAKNG